MGSYWSSEETKPSEDYIDVADELQNEKNEIKGDEILKETEMEPDVPTKRRKSSRPRARHAKRKKRSRHAKNRKLNKDGLHEDN